MSKHPEYQITLRVLPRDEGDEFRRLRAALKCLLRSFNLRCTRIVPAIPEETEDKSTEDSK